MDFEPRTGVGNREGLVHLRNHAAPELHDRHGGIFQS